MDFLKKILNLSSILFGLFLLLYLGGMVYWLYEKIRYKATNPAPVNPFGLLRYFSRNSDLGYAVLILVMATGLTNEIASRVFASNEIGAFYERSNYDESYEAYIYPDENSDASILCIVDLYKGTDADVYPYRDSQRIRYNTRYTIYAVNLPYGKVNYVDELYDPKDSAHYIGLGEWSRDCRIELIGIATESSYQRLENFVITNYGPYCASQNSDIFHDADCRHVTSITDKNLVYFHSPEEAEVCGYTRCSVCNW